MKVMTVLGTRPEIIRLSRIIEKLDKHCDHILVHTGQNFDKRLNELFFEELNVREPNYHLGVQADSIAAQIARIFIETEKVILKEKPDRALILRKDY
jgi:UDP-N-acetylglucosamine 2-epimerase (non-hydrolysing)